MTQRDKPDAPEARPRRRWRRVLLFVSLALNLIIFGIVGGAFLSHSRGDDHPSRMSRELGLGPYLFALDADGRKELRKRVDENRDVLRKSRIEWRDNFNQSLQVLRAEAFDLEQFNALVASGADLASAGQMVGQEILSSQVADMSVEERREFADRLEKGLKFGKGRDKDRGGSRKER